MCFCRLGIHCSLCPAAPSAQTLQDLSTAPSGGAIVGGIFAGLAIVALLAAALVFMQRRGLLPKSATTTFKSAAPEAKKETGDVEMSM